MSSKDETGKSEFDAFSDTYDDAVNGALAFSGLKVDFFTRVKVGYLLDLTGEALGPTATLRLADIGCGIGNYHGLLRPHFASIAGVDVSPASIARATRRNPNVEYRAYDGLTLPYSDATFDVAVAICVMHHVPPAQWGLFAHEMARILRPGGMALVFEHNPANPLTRRVVSNCEFDKDAVLLRPARTLALLAGAGLQKSQARSILSVPASNAAMRRIDSLLSPLGLGAQYVAWGRKSVEV